MKPSHHDAASRPDPLVGPGQSVPAVQDSALVRTAEPLRPVTEPLPPVPPPRKRLRFGLIVALLAATGSAGAAAFWYWLGPSGAPVTYKTAVVDRGPIAATVTATGTVNPVISVQVGSQVSGIVRNLYADYNSAVKEGQLLAQINPEPFLAKVKQARANLKTAEGNLEKARNMLAQRALEHERMARLREQQFVSQADLDLARTNYRDAEAQVGVTQAQVDQARATLASAELDLQYTKIHSPVNGIVVSRNVDVGQTVVASFQTPTLFVIAQDLTRMQVNANVSEADIGGVTEGKDAEFTVDAYPAEIFRGTVTQVRNAPISIQNVVTYDVIVGVDNRELKLKPGMTANVSVVTARSDAALRVPNTALRFKMPGVPAERKQPMVWVLDPAGHPRAVAISIGVADAHFTEVTAGEVREGDAVIVGLETVGGEAQPTLPPGFGVGPKIR